MIPEQYWQIIRRWFWIIILLGVAGGAAGVFLLPMGLGSGAAAYDASMTLGVSRLVSFGGTLTPGLGGGGEGTIVADYTASIAEKAKTVQFQARLRAATAERGLTISEAALPQKLSVTADRALFRINIRATASSAKDAEILAEEAANVLAEQVAAEETRIKEGLGANTDERRADLLSRLTEVNKQRDAKLQSLDASALQTVLADLATRGTTGANVTAEFKAIMADLALITGDQDLASLNSHADALERQLAALAQAEESFAVDLLKYGEPTFVLNPVETVATEPDSGLRKRDTLVLGGGVGLIMGWVVANMAEHVRNGRGFRRDEEEGEA